MSFDDINDFPLLRFDEMTLIVAGSNSNWGNPPIEDAVYNHIRTKWSITDPEVSEFDVENIAWEGMGSYHIFVEAGRRHGDKNRDIGSAQMSYYQRLRIHVIMNRLHMGEIDNQLDVMAAEVERILWEYSPYWIAGIEYFDNVDVIPLDEADTESNPFKNTWHCLVEADAYYVLLSDFQMETTPYDPSQHAAGDLTYQ